MMLLFTGKDSVSGFVLFFSSLSLSLSLLHKFFSLYLNSKIIVSPGKPLSLRPVIVAGFTLVGTTDGVRQGQKVLWMAEGGSRGEDTSRSERHPPPQKCSLRACQTSQRQSCPTVTREKKCVPALAATA